MRESLFNNPDHKESVCTREFGLVVGVVLGILVGSVIWVWWANTPPSVFPTETSIIVPHGAGAKTIGKNLESLGVIKSHGLFMLLLSVSGNESRLLSGEYIFSKPISTQQIIHAMVAGSYGAGQTKITIPEGLSNNEIAELLLKKNPKFDTNTFLRQAREQEGYLFPNTYLLFHSTTPAELIDQMLSLFRTKIQSAGLNPDATNFTHIVIVASLLEDEATSQSDARMIAGIIENRLKRNMPLQIDATVGYLTGKPSLQLTHTDLQIDSPYNTYKYRGLPPGPINNPGLAMILAANSPTPSNYLYYLHDTDGVAYYASSYQEHLRNRQKYIVDRVSGHTR